MEKFKNTKITKTGKENECRMRWNELALVFRSQLQKNRSKSYAAIENFWRAQFWYSTMGYAVYYKIKAGKVLGECLAATQRG